MTTTLTNKGQILLPAKLRRELGLIAGQTFDISLAMTGDQAGKIVLAPRPCSPRRGTIAIDPETKLPVMKGSPGTRKVTSAQVRRLLTDFS
jgi:AbrB family looped-hinge helix DNA binding protein